MENITAEEFVKEYLYITKDAEEGEEESVHDSISNVVDLVISFAILFTNLSFDGIEISAPMLCAHFSLSGNIMYFL